MAGRRDEVARLPDQLKVAMRLSHGGDTAQQERENCPEARLEYRFAPRKEPRRGDKPHLQRRLGGEFDAVDEPSRIEQRWSGFTADCGGIMEKVPLAAGVFSFDAGNLKGRTAMTHAAATEHFQQAGKVRQLPHGPAPEIHRQFEAVADLEYALGQGNSSDDETGAGLLNPLAHHRIGRQWRLE